MTEGNLYEAPKAALSAEGEMPTVNAVVLILGGISGVVAAVVGAFHLYDVFWVVFPHERPYRHAPMILHGLLVAGQTIGTPVAFVFLARKMFVEARFTYVVMLLLYLASIWQWISMLSFVLYLVPAALPLLFYTGMSWHLSRKVARSLNRPDSLRKRGVSGNGYMYTHPKKR